MSGELLWVFVTASAALALAPGPTMLLALSNGISGGARAAFGGIVGASLGAGLLIALVGLGLGSVLAASETLFQLVRWAGVAYLGWIGVRLWRAPPPDLAAAALSVRHRTPVRQAFARSLAVALSNPKTLVFFAAFLPQFVDAQAPQAMQYLTLGSLFIGIDACVMALYALAGTQALRWLSGRSVQLLHRGCAVGMWLLACALAAWRRPAG